MRISATDMLVQCATIRAGQEAPIELAHLYREFVRQIHSDMLDACKDMLDFV